MTISPCASPVMKQRKTLQSSNRSSLSFMCLSPGLNGFNKTYKSILQLSKEDHINEERKMNFTDFVNSNIFSD